MAACQRRDVGVLAGTEGSGLLAGPGGRGSGILSVRQLVNVPTGRAINIIEKVHISKDYYYLVLVINNLILESMVIVISIDSA